MRRRILDHEHKFKSNKRGEETMSETKAVVETVSQRFVEEIEKQFKAEVGDSLAFTEYEKTLAQHMFAKIDATLKSLEIKRSDKGVEGLPVKWENINMTKLALDAVHRIGLGLDALIPNHLHPIPYFNKRLKKYDLDLRLGYVGKDYCRRELAIEKPLDIRYELVYKNDVFKPLIRGEVIGGFGYIMYEDTIKNKLIIVPLKEFEKAEKIAKTQDFWGESNWKERMQYKTLVHRVTDKLPIDPKKLNIKSYAYVESQEGDAIDIKEEKDVSETVALQNEDKTDQDLAYQDFTSRIPKSVRADIGKGKLLDAWEVSMSKQFYMFAKAEFGIEEEEAKKYAAELLGLESIGSMREVVRDAKMLR